MDAKRSPIHRQGPWLLIIFVTGLAGCQHSMHQNPYQQGMYGQPIGAPQQMYGSPAPYGGSPYGQPMAPSMMAPGVSSVPADNFYAPSPVPQQSDAPPFGASPQPVPAPPKSSGDNSVPKYKDPSNDSPYFEQNSQLMPPNGVPQTAAMASTPPAAVSGLTNANYASPTPDDQALELTSGDQFQAFEPPMTRQKKADVAGEFSPSPFGSMPPAAADDPAELTATEPATEPRPMESPFELAAPPVDDVATSPGDALEGVVRLQPGTNTWVFVFPGGPSPSAPFGGRLELTGTPAALQILKDNQMFQLQGFIEQGNGSTIPDRFHVQQATPVASPAAPASLFPQ